MALVLVTPLSVVAARWQWNRHLERDALNAAVTQAEQQRTVPWDSISGHFPNDWRTVTATGHWVVSGQRYVRKQTVNGEVGFSVLTPFDATARWSDRPQRLLVLRGWIPDTVDPAVPGAVPAPPQDTVTVTLRWRTPSGAGEMRPSDLPEGQINFVDPEQFGPEYWDHHSSIYAVFELLDPVPNGLVALPAPTLTSGPHLSYFVQWILIGFTGIVVYVRVFRSELRLSREQSEDETQDV